MDKDNVIIYVMMLGTFGVLSTEMGVVGILPQISQYFNVSITDAGLFVSIFALGIAIFGIFMPLIFSKYDRKKSFAMVLAVFTVTSIMSGFTTDFKLALLLRFIPSIVHPVYCGLALTVAGEISQKQNSQSAISKVIMGVSAGMIVGVPITTFIASNFGYQVSMLVLALITFIAFIATVILFPTLPGKEQSYSSQISAAKTGIFIISVFGIIFLNGAIYSGYSYISEFLNVMTGIVNNELSIVLFIYGISSMAGNWLGGKLLDKSAKNTVLSLPILLSVIMFLMFMLGFYKIPVVVLMIFWGLLAGIGNDVLQYCMVSAAPQAPEFANGIFLSTGNIGVTFGTTVSGFVLATSGVRYTMIVSITIALISFALLSVRFKKFKIEE